jgi:hypothetical protein
MLKNTAGRTRKRISLISLVIYAKGDMALHLAISTLRCITSIMRDNLQGNSISGVQRKLGKWSLTKSDLTGKFTIRRCTLQGVITLGREGSIWALTDSSRFPYPFFLVPVGPGDHSATPSEFLCKRQLQTPTLTLYQRKGIYGILGQENPFTLSLDIRGELSPTLVLILRTVVGKAHPTLVGRMSDKDPTKLE